MLGDTSSRTNSSTGGIAVALTGVTQASLIKDDVEMGGTGTIPGTVTSESADCMPTDTQSADSLQSFPLSSGKVTQSHSM